MSSNNSQDWESRRLEIKASLLKDRFDGGRECPLREKLYALAEEAGEGAPNFENLSDLQKHLDRCTYCRRVFDTAVAVMRPDENVAMCMNATAQVASSSLLPEPGKVVPVPFTSRDHTLPGTSKENPTSAGTGSSMKLGMVGKLVGCLQVKGAVAILIPIFLVGATVGSLGWEAVRRMMTEQGIDRYIRWAFHNEEHPSTDPDKASPIHIHGQTAWIQGEAMANSVREIHVIVEAEQGGQKPWKHVEPISNDPTRKVATPFKIRYPIPNDGITRIVKIVLIPHEEAKSYPPFKQEKNLAYTAWLSCSPEGPSVSYVRPEPVRSEPRLSIAWSNPESRQLQLTWSDIPRQPRLWIWFADENWAFPELLVQQSSSQRTRTVGDGLSEVLIAEPPPNTDVSTLKKVPRQDLKPLVSRTLPQVPR